MVRVDAEFMLRAAAILILNYYNNDNMENGIGIILNNVCPQNVIKSCPHEAERDLRILGGIEMSANGETIQN